MSAVPGSLSEGPTLFPASVCSVTAIEPVAIAAPRAVAISARPVSTLQTISLVGPDVVGKGTDAIYTVRLLTAPGEKTVTVAYTTRNIGARAGVNYTQTSGTLTFTADETVKTIRVPALASSPEQLKPATFAVDLSQAKVGKTLVPINGKILNKSIVTRIIPPAPAPASAPSSSRRAEPTSSSSTTAADSA